MIMTSNMAIEVVKKLPDLNEPTLTKQIAWAQHITADNSYVYRPINHVYIDRITIRKHSSYFTFEKTRDLFDISLYSNNGYKLMEVCLDTSEKTKTFYIKYQGSTEVMMVPKSFFSKIQSLYNNIKKKSVKGINLVDITKLI